MLRLQFCNPLRVSCLRGEFTSFPRTTDTKKIDIDGSVAKGPRGAKTSEALNTNAVIWCLCVCVLQTATRQELLDYFDNTWTLTEVLFSGLQVMEPLTVVRWLHSLA